MGFIDFLGDNLVQFWEYTGFANCTLPHLAMILVGLFFIYLAIKKNFEPMLLVPIGFGILIGNIPFKIDAGLEVGIYEEGSVLNILYQGVSAGWYPPLVLRLYSFHRNWRRILWGPLRFRHILIWP